jgi:hypothetical protein
MTRMPFGQFKGRPLADLPDTYVEWLLALDDLRQPLRAAVWREWERRTGPAHAEALEAPTISLKPEEVALARRVFDAGYRATAAQLHPDHVGGDGQQMTELNALAASVRQQFGALEAGIR